jgi:hypothetical protein
MKFCNIFTAAAMLAMLSACAPTIRGTIQLVDMNNKPLPAAVATPEGSVVNMINKSAPLEQASYSLTTGPDGKFESEKDMIKQGQYDVEVSHIGYQTETRTVEVGSFSSPTVDVSLRKIPETRRKSIKGSRSDEDKIINPGEVNIQPPSM